MSQGTERETTFEERYYFEKQATEEWIPYEGPHGGEGWQRVGDGEVRYQDHPPGEVAEGTDPGHWGQSSADWSDLATYLDDHFDRKTLAEVFHRVKATEELTDHDAGRISEYLLGRFQHRQRRLDSDVRNATSEELTDLVDSTLSRYEEEVQHRESLDQLGTFVEDHSELDTRTKLNISDMVRRVQDETDLSEEHIRNRLYYWVSDDEVDPEEALSEESLNDFADNQIREWRSEEFEASEAIEIPDGYEAEDVEYKHVKEALSEVEIAHYEVDWVDGDPLRSAVEKIEEIFGDSPNELHEQIEALNDGLRGVLRPYSQSRTSAPDHLNPQNAEKTIALKDFTDKTGRSASSMHVAKGVPDEDGNERTLFVTNTNPERHGVKFEHDEDGDRQVLGSAGFQAAGFDAPDAYHEPGEFWAVEEAPGDTADEYHVDDLDNPIEQFGRLGAVGALLGAWDLHEGNVFVHDGEFIPVDMDLAGNELHHEVNHRNNKFGGGLDNMMGLFPRLEKLHNRMDGKVNGGDDAIREAVKRHVQDLAETGEVREIAEAAKDSMSNRIYAQNIEANATAIENENFFETYPDDQPDEEDEEMVA